MSASNHKKGKKIVLTVFIGLCVLLLLTFGVYSYTKKIQKENTRAEFFEKVQNNELGFFMENEVYSALLGKLKNSNYESNSTLKLSTTMENNMFSKLDVSKFAFNDILQNNENEGKSYQRVGIEFAGNSVISLDLMNQESEIAAKSDEIVNRYVGLSKENTAEIVGKLFGEKVDLEEMQKLKDFTLDREWIDFQQLAGTQSAASLGTLLKENTSAENFSKKENIVLDLDSEQVPTTEYTAEVTSQQVNNILNGVVQILEKDDEILKMLVVSEPEKKANETNVLQYTPSSTAEEEEQAQDLQQEQTGEIRDDSENNQTQEVQQIQEVQEVQEESAEENNFNAPMRIWSQNENVGTSDSNINPVPADTNTTNTSNTANNVNVNPTPANTAPANNTAAENTAPSQNTAAGNNNTAETPAAAPETPPAESQEPQVETITPELPAAEPENPPAEQNHENTANATNTAYVQEDENVRRKGYIEVNEEPGENAAEGDDEEAFVIGENYQETIQNIAKLTKKIDWQSYLTTGAKANCTEKDLLVQIKKRIEDRGSNLHTWIVKLYVSENKAVKLNLEIPETAESFDFTIISKGDNEKYLELTHLLGKDEEANGHTVSLYKKNADADTKMKIAVNKIHQNKINQKTNLELDTKGGANSKKYTTDIDVSYSDNSGEFKMEVGNSLNFESSPEIEDLTEENCLFLDQISEEDLLYTKDAIKQKTMEVLKEKNKNLNMIDSNNVGSIVGQAEQQAEEDTQQAEVEQALIKVLSDKMKEYENHGNQLKLEDLEGLEVPGYETEISISPNLAIITVGGYKFKLDSDFNLSDS